MDDPRETFLQDRVGVALGCMSDQYGELCALKRGCKFWTSCTYLEGRGTIQRCTYIKIYQGAFSPYGERMKGLTCACLAVLWLRLLLVVDGAGHHGWIPA